MKLRKRKYNRGRYIKDDKWIFGGIERGTQNAFMMVVSKKDAETLLPIIEKEIEDETFIISDGWKTYNKIPEMGHDYNHKQINHSKNFVDPNKLEKAVHTQSIEALWSRFRLKLRTMRESSQKHLNGIISEFLHKEKYKKHFCTFLHHFFAYHDFFYSQEVNNKKKDFYQ